MEEYKHLINDYLVKNNQIMNRGFHAMSADYLNEVLHNLVPFERPDMYAVIGDAVVIIEHFEFDASRSTSKGMVGKQEEAHLRRRIKQAAPDGTWNIDAVNYEISFDNWKENFERNFKVHYQKIEDYKLHVIEKLGHKAKILTGFFIENQLPPLVEIGKAFYELSYSHTRQFAQFYRSHLAVDFILFGGCYNGHPQIEYIDHESLRECSGYVDLTRSDVKISRLNKNEVVCYGCFLFSTEDGWGEEVN